MASGRTRLNFFLPQTNNWQSSVFPEQVYQLYRSSQILMLYFSEHASYNHRIYPFTESYIHLAR